MVLEATKRRLVAKVESERRSVAKMSAMCLSALALERRDSGGEKEP